MPFQDTILEPQTISKLLELNESLLQLLLAIDTATMEQSIYRNKTAKLFEREQTYCAQILLLWGKKSPYTPHTPMFTKFGPLYEEYHGLTYVPMW